VKEAVADLAAAVGLEPGSAVAWYQLARAYERAGDEERALEACRRALATAPAGSRLAARAGEMEERLGARRGDS
jgi:Tfp pilus assembly protein PilF